jgi:hypothetical protein
MDGGRGPLLREPSSVKYQETAYQRSSGGNGAIRGVELTSK